jgi:3-oxoacyl-[acyl-carrier-protein] synthase II
MQNNEPERVVVTGVGAISSIGAGREVFWRELLAGRSGVSPIVSCDTAGYEVRIGAEVKDFNPGDYIRRHPADSYGRASQLGIAAAQWALRDAGLDSPRLAGRRASVCIGTTMGECQVVEAAVRARAQQGSYSFALRELRKAPENVLALNIARELALEARCMVFPNACAAGNYAIGSGFDQIQEGEADIVLAGGCDAFSMVALTGFGRMLALSPDRCRPFDKNRQGIVVGEGAGILVLESLSRARQRQARIYAEVLGYGLSCDASHMTIPHLPGVVAVMRKALQRSRVEPGDVSVVSAHGTGTRINDKTECEAIRQFFGSHAESMPVFSIKSMLGHSMGAASAFEAIACVLAVSDGKIPPTINYETPDEDCPIDCVPNRHRESRVRVALNNSFAFGGNNAATVFGRFS